MMIARYERGKLLNVRKKPSTSSQVVRTMRPGEEAECLEVSYGWAKLADGYANASLLVVRDGGAAEKHEEPHAEEQHVAEPEPSDDDASELRAMTVSQLRDLAEQSGIALSKNMKKDDIIAAILADE